MSAKVHGKLEYMADVDAHGEYRIRTPQELIAALDAEVSRNLTSKGVCEVLAYGWLDHDTPDPEYLGLAIWQTSAPFEPDWSALLSGGIVEYEPTALDEALTRAGEDFIGTMNFAHRSIGMALCRASNTDLASLDGVDAFWYEYTTSIQWLNIAADRLRQFFKAAFPSTGKKKKGQRKTRSYSSYSAPFRETDPVDEHDKKLMSSLLPLVNNLQNHQEERDRIVHEMATSAAKRAIDTLRRQREHARTGKPIQIPDLTFEQLRASAMVNPMHEAISAAVQDIQSWYERLIHASNIVFELEHTSRTNRRR